MPLELFLPLRHIVHHLDLCCHKTFTKSRKLSRIDAYAVRNLQHQVLQVVVCARRELAEDPYEIQGNVRRLCVIVLDTPQLGTITVHDA